MGALPKRKKSLASTGERRSNKSIKPPALDECPQCHSPKSPHHVCPTCGTYNGREVIKIEGQRKKTG
jgi:large subunit ribosomal protein L32